MQKALSGPKHSLTFRNKYLAVVMSVAAFILSSVSSFGQGAAPPGYAPKVQSYGNWYNRLRADSAQHIPNKACLCKNDNDTTPQLFIYMDTLRGFWNGAFHNIGFGGGSGGTDTIYVTSIGTGSPQVQMLYAVNGNLRAARIVNGLFTIPVMNADSAVHIDVDTTALATWNGITSRGGFTNIYNTDGILTGDRHLSGSLTHNLDFDSINNFRVNPTGHGQSIELVGGGFSSVLIVQQGNQYQSITGTPFVVGTHTMWPDSIAEYMVNSNVNKTAGYRTNTDSIVLFSINATTDSSKIVVYADSIKFWGYGAGSRSGTAAFNLGVTANGKLVEVTGGGGGGTTNGVGRDTITTITSGTASTVPNGTNIIRFNSTGVLTYTLTLPTTWHTSNDLLIAFTSNGTITNGNLMVNLTVVNGSGHTLSYSSNPTASYKAGEILRFHLISTIEQCIN